MLKIIIERLLHIGEIPLCNGIASRAFHLGDFCFILCYRCSGVIIGVMLCWWYLKIHKVNIKYFLLIIPMIIDGFLQLLTPYVSNNPLRLITGLLFGIGMVNGIVYISEIICDAVS